MVNITNIRLYLDFALDESYTPTRIAFLAGTSYYDLIAFAELTFEQPRGWIDLDLTGVGGGRDGNVLRAFVVQMKVLENHQNGKDSHVRGLKIYAQEEYTRAADARRRTLWEHDAKEAAITSLGDEDDDGDDGLLEPGWLANPVLR
jgi:hypothetical protein